LVSQEVPNVADALTKRQRDILDFISASIMERGFPPTLREIGEHFNIRSTNGVNDHLKALEKKGHLRREDLKSRATPPQSRAMPPQPHRMPAGTGVTLDVGDAPAVAITADVAVTTDVAGASDVGDLGDVAVRGLGSERHTGVVLPISGSPVPPDPPSVADADTGEIWLVAADAWSRATDEIAALKSELGVLEFTLSSRVGE
jgi:hypothetical protein